MTTSVETAKDDTASTSTASKDANKDAASASPNGAVRSGKTVAAAEALSRRIPFPRPDPRMVAVATVALAVGAGLGMLAAPRGHSNEALVRIEAGLETGRTETARLNAEIEQFARTLSRLREASEAARSEGRSESRSLGASVGERLTRLEQSLDRKIASLAEKPATVDRETGTPQAATTAQVERRAAVAVAPPATTATAAAARAEPTQTASITDTRPKADTVEAWALRDVYDGVAMLEDRKRRLVEVAPGDAVPGVGRVESIERRGRSWVVVTRQGLITPQLW